MAGFFKRSAKKTGSKISDWMGLSITAGVFLFVKDIFVAVFMPWKREPAGPPETFEQAVARLDLSEADIQGRQKMFLQQTVLYFLLGIAVISYGVFLAFEHAITGMVMCLMVSLVAFANAFRAHFWYFQTKQRKLGCTIQEWLNAGVGG
jgi:intracellular multiplication protein IcmV